ncbi:MAG: copper chaperone PCu(A)C, partial [Gemmatimonadales bacterium]|nr:copper chaperone PCu(A)C [Gemmatimonadales bacterium]
AELGGAEGGSAGLTIRRAVAWAEPEIASATVGFEVVVQGPADTLVGVGSPAGRAALHASGAGPAHGMHPLERLPLSTGRTMVDGREVHVMVQQLAPPLATGDTLALELRFARAGTVRLDVPVLRFSEALTVLGR